MKYKNLIKRFTSGLLVLLLLLGDLSLPLSMGSAYAEGVDIPIKIIDYTDPANHPANTDIFASTVPGQNLTGNTVPLNPDSGNSVSADSTLGGAGTAGTGSVSATPGSGTSGGTTGSTTIVNPDGTVTIIPSTSVPGESNGELVVSDLVAGARYAVVDTKPMKYTVSYEGGTAPYHVHFAVRLNGDLCFEQREDLPEAGVTGFEWIPRLYGTHDVAVTVRDAMGKTVSKGRSIPVAVYEIEDFDAAVSGVELTGDWAADLVAIAGSQLGRGENKRNFHIDENGTSYYSMYSHWCYDNPFAPWESAFVLFCIDKAGVPAKAFPRSADISEWISTLKTWELYVSAAEHQPVAGDIAFLSSGSVGIVAEVRDGLVYIIDGDRADCDHVDKYVHSIGDGSIIGYGRLGTVQTNPSTYVPAPKALTLSVAAAPQISDVGDEVSFSAVVPSDINTGDYLWQWQMSPDGNTWIDVDGAYEPVWTVKTGPAHYLNYIRVIAKPMEANRIYARSYMSLATAASEPESEEESNDSGSTLYAAAPMLLSVRSSGDSIYWNPYGSPTFSEDGVVIVYPGNDSNDGTSIRTPVLSFAKAVQLAASGKTIICMNLYNSYDDEASLSSVTNQLSIIGYDGGGDASAAHEGQYFSAKSGTLTLTNLYIEETESVLELDGGKVVLGDKLHMPGTIFINRPTPNSVPISITGGTSNQANSGAYTISFNPDYVGSVGIATGDHTTDGLILLDQSLTDRGWTLYAANGSTYAHIPPVYNAIYLDGVYGSDDNLGNSEARPVRTLKRAQELLAMYKGEGKVNTIYVMGTVTLISGTSSNDSEKPYVFSMDVDGDGSQDATLLRHERCTDAMIKVSGGEPEFNLILDGSNIAAPVFEAAGGKLTIKNTTLLRAPGTAVKMSGGSLEIDGTPATAGGASTVSIPANAASIVSGSAAAVTLKNLSLTSTGPVVELTSATSFSTENVTYNGPADRTLVVSGTASFVNTNDNTNSVNDGAGHIHANSGSLTVDNMNLAKITAASTVTVKNCAVTTIENTGSSTTIENVTGLDSVTAAGTLTIKGSGVVNATSTGTSATVENSHITGTLTASGTATLTGTFTDGVSTTNVKTLTAEGNTSIQGAAVTTATSHGATNTVTNSTVGTLTFDGNTTITNSTVTEATTKDSTITNGKKADNTDGETKIEKLTASGNTTLTSGSVSTLISTGANVTANGGSIDDLSLRGNSSTLITSGVAKTPKVALVGNEALIKLSGDPSANNEKIELDISNEFNGRVVVQGSGYDASQHIIVDNPAGSLFQRVAGSSKIFWLDKSDNDIIVKARTGVYVDTARGAYNDAEASSLGTENNPFKTFAEAAEMLSSDSSLPRIIYVIGTGTIQDGDTLKPTGEKVTVMPYDNRSSTLISVPADATFAPTNVDFDGAGLKTPSTLFEVNGTLNLSSATAKNAGTIINMPTADSSVTLSASTLEPNTGGVGVSMTNGSLTATGGTINVNGSGKGIVVTDGAATVASRINVNSSNGTGIDVDGGLLNFSGSIYGINAITIDNAVADISGKTYSSTGSYYSTSYGKVVSTNSTINVKSGAIISALTQNSGTTNVSGGTVYNMTMADGTLNVRGGTVSYLTHNKGTTNLSSGTIQSSTMKAGETKVTGGRISSSITMSGSLAGSTLDVSGGTVSNVYQNGGTFTLTGGIVGSATVNDADSVSRIYANGGSISYAYMLGQNSILHTNGQCSLNNVYLGRDGSEGANAYIALSGDMAHNCYIIVGDANYYENYSVVKPEDPDTDSTDQLEKFSIDRMKKRFNLAAGTGDKSTHIVLSFDGVFIDTTNGEDENDGLSYSNAVKTFARAGQVMSERLAKDSSLVPVIYVVNRYSPYTPATATISDTDTLDMRGVSSNNGKVYVSAFNSKSDLLISVPSGTTFNVFNADIDGVGNNEGLYTTNVIDVAGTFNISDGSVKNGRGTVMTVSGTATLDTATVQPFSSNISSATTVKINGGTLNINDSSTVYNGKYGVDMDGGTLNVTKGTVRGAYTYGVWNKGGTVTVASEGSISNNSGRGVNMASGTLTLTGGSISSNSYGGVVMSGGTFTMNSGSVSSNGTTYNSSNGGVTVSGGTFTMYDGSIASNRSVNPGGGISVTGTGAVTVSAGSITGNTSSGHGGGVYLNGGSFTMSGGSLTNNTSSANGGGLYAAAGSSMSINGTADSKLNITGNKASNGAGLYYDCGLTDPTYVNLSGNVASGNGGGIYINGNSTGHTHTLSTFSITGNTAGNGGGLYNNCSAKVDLSGTVMTGNTAKSNGGALYTARGEVVGNNTTNLSGSNASNGGAIYVTGGSVSLPGADLSGSDATEGSYGSGGAAYITGGTVDLTGANLSNCKAEYTSTSSSTGTTYNGGQGGAVFVSGGTVTLDSADMSSATGAARGGALYVAGGSVSLRNSTLSTSATENGKAVYATGGTVDFEGDISGSGELVYTTGSSVFNHISGTITGNVTAGGSYVVTLPAAYVSGELTLSSSLYPLKISEASTEAVNVFNLNADKYEFTGSVIVDGNSKVPATKEKFVVIANDTNIKDYSLVGDDLLGAVGMDVYWDPTGSYGNDNNSGESHQKAVKTFAKAKTLLAQKGAAGRIILCSTAKDASYDGTIDSTVYASVTKPWNAKVVRLQSFTGVMFSGVKTLDDIIISGEAHDESGPVFVNNNMISVASTGLVANNIEVCYFDGAGEYMAAMAGGPMEISNSKLHDNTISQRLGDYGNEASVFYMNNASLTLRDTDIYNNVCTVTSNGIGHFYLCDITIEGGTISNNTGGGCLFNLREGTKLYADGVQCLDNNSTVFSGNTSFDVATELYFDNCLFSGNEDETSVISAIYCKLDINNCQFINNKATGSFDSWGGGTIFYYCYSATDDYSFSVTDSTFIGNIGEHEGGAICVNSMLVPVVRGCLFENNKAVNGGAIFARCEVEVENSTFINNTATGNGGAVYMDNNNDVNHAFSSNSNTYVNNSAVNGGAIYTKCNETNISDDEFIENTATAQGAAIYHKGASARYTRTLTVENSKFSSNICGSENALAGTIICADGLSLVSINDSEIGNATATDYPQTVKDALDNGGNAALHMIGNTNEMGEIDYSFTDTQVDGNYAPNGAVSLMAINMTRGSADYNSHTGILAPSNCQVIYLDSVSASGNGVSGLDASKAGTLLGFNLLGCTIDNNAGYGAYIPTLSIVNNRQPVIGKGSGTVNSSFSGNGKTGLYIDGKNYIVDGTPLPINGVVISNNGKNDAEGHGHGLHLVGNASATTPGKVKLENATISGNGSSATTKGGGVYVGEGINLLLSDTVTVSENEANKGGAIYWEQHSTYGTNNASFEQGNGATLSGNKAVYGGAIYADKDVTFGGFNIIGNEAEKGGGLYVKDGAKVTVQHDDVDNANGGSIETVFSDNEAQYGGAIYMEASESGEVDLNFAVIEGNTSTADVFDYAADGLSSGIYNAGAELHMGGSNVDITDNIYLHNRNYPVLLTSSMSRGVIYNVALNMAGDSGDATRFNYGDVVIGPTATYKNAAQWLRYVNEVVPGNVFAKGTCRFAACPNSASTTSVDAIILKRCLFVDGINGVDNSPSTHDGQTPSKAFKTMEYALSQISSDNYVIYICGPVYPASEVSTWSHGSVAIDIRRYTGFAVGGESSFEPYDGDLVVVRSGEELTIGDNISYIAGWHDPADPVTPSGSIFNVNGGGTLNFAGNTTLEGNISSAQGGAIHIGHDAPNAMVNVTGSLTITDVAGINGGAVCVDEGSTLEVSGALNVSRASAVNGGAIYNQGTVNNFGTISLHGNSASGNGDGIYNSGTLMLKNGSTLDTIDEVYITDETHITLESSGVTLMGTAYKLDEWDQEVEDTENNVSGIPVSIGDARDGRVYARYLEGSYTKEDNNVKAQRLRYVLPTAITSSYLLTSDVQAEGSKLDLILSQSNIVYVDPDYTGGDKPGMTKGYSPDYPFTNLYDAYSKLASGTNGITGGLIYIVTPVEIDQDTTVGLNSYSGAGGSVGPMTGGVSIRRYSKPESYTDSNGQRGFTKKSNLDEMFIVNSGVLTLDGVPVDGNSNAVISAGPETQFTIAAAVVADRPIVTVKGGELRLTNDASLINNNVADDNIPDAVYNDSVFTIVGKSSAEDETVIDIGIDGSVYLAGSDGVANDRYITVEAADYVNPVDSITVLINDPADGRPIAKYDGKPAEGETEKYVLSQDILDAYKLVNDGDYIVLRARNAVYVSGSGRDSAEGTPDAPIATLREAYTRLEATGGTIYIVDTLPVAGSVDFRVTGTYFQDGSDHKVIINGGNTVSISRYSKPSASTETAPIEGYTRESHKGMLFNISNGSSLTLSNIVVDGHGTAFTGGQTTTAPAVEAEDAMFIVSGNLELGSGTTLRNNNNSTDYGTGGAIRIAGTGSVSMLSGSSIDGNSARYGDGIFNAGTLSMGGSVNFGTEQWIYESYTDKDNYNFIHVTGSLTGSTIPVELTQQAVNHNTIIASYGGELIPVPSRFVLTSENNSFMTTRKLTKTEKAQDVILLASYDVKYHLNGITTAENAPVLAACEEDFRTTLAATATHGLPESIAEIKVTSLDSNDNQVVKILNESEYSYNPANGIITIPGTFVTGDIDITAEGVELHDITYTLSSGITGAAGNPVGVRENDGFSARFTLADGYHEPTVKVKVGESYLDESLYRYINGGLTVEPGCINANVVVELSTQLKDYPVTVRVVNASIPTLTGTFVQGNELRVTHGVGLSGTVTRDDPSTASMPESISVSVNGYPISGYTYDPTTGALNIPDHLVTGEVLITGIALIPTYNVYYALTPDGGILPIENAPTQANKNQTLTTGIYAASESYLLPDSVTVTRAEENGNTTTLTGGQYSYNKNTGIITINPNVITGDITITANGFEQVSITQDFTNVQAATLIPANVVVGSNTDVSFTVLPELGFKLPASISVTYDPADTGEGEEGGEVVLEAVPHVTYDQSTGEVLIPAASITDDLTITIVGVPVYTVTYDLGALLVKGDPAPETVDQGEALVFAIAANLDRKGAITVPSTVKVNGVDYNVGENGLFTVPADDISGNLLVVAAGSQSFTITAQPANVTDMTGGMTTINANARFHGEHDYTDDNITANEGYVLPGSISVNYNGNAETPVSGYTWSVVDGKGSLIIPADKITDHITVTVEAIKEHTVTFDDAPDADGSVQGMPRSVKVLHGEALPAQTVTAARGFKLTGISVSTGNVNDYIYTPTETNGEVLSATISAIAGVVTGDVTITVNAARRSYAITETVTNADVPGAYDKNDANDGKDKDKTVTDGAPFTATIAADEHYTLPTEITVSINGGQPITINGDGQTGASGITYNKTTGELTIPGNEITGPVVIGGAAVPKTYAVTTDVGNLLTYSGATGDNAATYGVAYTASVSERTDAKGNVTRPATVSYTVTGGAKDSTGKEPYTANVDAATGQFTIPADHVTGSIAITARGVQTFTVTTDLKGQATADKTFPASVNASEGTATEDVSFTVTANKDYTLPDSISVTDTAGNAVTHSYSKSTGDITVDEADIHDNITITVDPLKVIQVTYEHAVPTGQTYPAGSSGTTPATVTEGTDFSAVFALADGYEYVDNGAVVTGLAEGAVSSFNKSTNTLTVDKQYITENLTSITVTVTTKLKTYPVTYAGSLTAAVDPTNNSATHGQQFVTDIKAVADAQTEDVRLPDSISVTYTGTETELSGVNYDSSTGAITIPGSAVNKPITITANGVRQYDVKYNLGELLEPITAQLVDENAATDEVTIARATGRSNVDLPESVTVTMANGTGTTTLTAGTHYSYDATTGKFSINPDVITGDVTVSAAGREWFTVDYQLASGSASDSITLPADVAKIYRGVTHGSTIAANPGYEITNVTVNMGGTDIKSSAYSEIRPTAPGIEEDVIGGNINIAKVTGNVVVVVSAEKRVYTVTENNDKYDISSTQDFIPTTSETIDVQHQQGTGDEPNVVITIDPIDSHNPPANPVISVYNPDTGAKIRELVKGDDYSYTTDANGNGVITLTDPSEIVGPIVITGDATIKTFTVSGNLTGITSNQTNDSATVNYGGSVTFNLTAVTGHNLPQTVNITGATYTRTDEDHATLTFDNVTADIEFTLAAQPETYAVTTDVGNLLSYSGDTGDNAAIYGVAYTASVSEETDAKGNVTRPATVSYTVTGGAMDSTGKEPYTAAVDSITGQFTIPAAHVTGSIAITARGVQTFTVTAEYSDGVSLAEGCTKVTTLASENESNASTDYTLTVQANSGMALPDYITVKVGPNGAEQQISSSDSTANGAIRYNKVSGVIFIPKTSITDNVTVTITDLQLHTVSYTENANADLPGASNVEHGKAYNGSFSAKEGYKITDVEVTMVGTTGELPGVYTPGSTTGDVLSGQVDIDTVTGDVTITVTTAKRQYTVTNTVNNSDIHDDTDNKITINHGLPGDGNVTITLDPEDGWDLPPTTGEGKLTITVKDPDDGVDDVLDYGTEYDYDPETGVIIIKKPELLDGDVTITGTAKLRTYTVSAVLTNLTAEFAGVTSVTVDEVTTHSVEHKKPANNAAAVTVDLADSVTGYDLPATVTVEVGEYKLEDFNGTDSTTGISYNATTGLVTIPAAVVTGHIVVTAVGTPEVYTVTYEYYVGETKGDYGTPTAEASVTYPAGYSSAISANDGYRIVGITVLMDGAANKLAEYDGISGETVFTGVLSGSKTHNEDYTDLSLSIGSTAVTGDVTVTVRLAKRVYEITNTGEHTDIDPDDDPADDKDNSIDKNHGDDEVVITVTPDTGYELPDDEKNITVTIKDPDDPNAEKPLDPDNGDYTYNPEDGTITIHVPITGPVEIDIDATPKTYGVEYVLGTLLEAKPVNDETTVADNKPVQDADFTAKIGITDKVKGNVSLPAELISVTVIVTGEDNSKTPVPVPKAAENVPGYTYDSSTGNITIPGSFVDGDVRIEAYGVQTFTIDATLGNTTADVDFVVTKESADETNSDSDFSTTLTAHDPAEGRGYVLPDSITIEIGDKPYTVESGEPYTIDDDSGKTLSYDAETGVVSITAAAITDNVHITVNAVPVYNVSYSYTDTQVTKDSGPVSVEENEALEARFTPAIGYSITGVTVKVTVDPTGNDDTRTEEERTRTLTGTTDYTWAESQDGKHSFTLNILEDKINGDVAVIVSSDKTKFDVDYVLGDKLTESDEAEEATYGEAYSTAIAVKDTAIGVVLPEEIEITMKAEKSDGSGYDIVTLVEGTHYSYNDETGAIEIFESYQETVVDENGNEITVTKPVIIGDITISATGIDTFKLNLDNLTLTAVDDVKRLGENQSKTGGYSLLDMDDAAGNEIIDVRLRGKTFTITDIVLDTISLDSKANIEGTATTPGKKFTAGSDYSNFTFGLTMMLNGENETDVAVGNSITFGDTVTNADLLFTLYNANALTLPGSAGYVEIKLVSSLNGTTIGDEITLRVNVERLISQINVTVPLVLVLKTNIDGGSATVADESYYLDNNSYTRLKLTGLQLEESQRDGHKGIMQHNANISDSDLLNQRDTYRVDFKAGHIGTELAADDAKTGNTAKADTYNPIAKVSTSPLTFVTNASEAYGLHLATVSYTVGIPAEDAPVVNAPAEDTQ